MHSSSLHIQLRRLLDRISCCKLWASGREIALKPSPLSGSSWRLDYYSRLRRQSRLGQAAGRRGLVRAGSQSALGATPIDKLLWADHSGTRWIRFWFCEQELSWAAETRYYNEVWNYCYKTRESAAVVRLVSRIKFIAHGPGGRANEVLGWDSQKILKRFLT